MNPRFRYYFLVGLFSVLALVVLFVSLRWVRGEIKDNESLVLKAKFDDAKGIATGSEVRLAGVRVGLIEAVDLIDNRAQLTLRIEKKYPIPRGSKFVVQTGLIGNTATLAVKPLKGVTDMYTDGEIIEGAPPPSILDTALNDTQRAQAEALLASGTKTAKSVEEITSSLANPRMQAELRRADETLRYVRLITANMAQVTNNLNETTASLPRITGQMEQQLGTLAGSANATLTNLSVASASGARSAKNIEQTTAKFGTMLDENKDTLNAILNNADEASGAIAGISITLNDTLADPKFKANLAETTTNLASITARLDATTADLQRFSSDPRIAADLRDTLANLKATTESVKNLTARVETLRLPGEKRTPVEGEPPPLPKKPATTSLLEPGLAVDSVYDTTLSRLRVDSNFTYLTGTSGRFYRLGLFDLSETNRLNLQVGQSVNGLPADFSYRLGLVNGKIGGGLDFRTGILDWRLDLFDPNRFTVNARLKGYVTRDRATSVTAGIDSVGKDNRAVFGVQIRK